MLLIKTQLLRLTKRCRRRCPRPVGLCRGAFPKWKWDEDSFVGSGAACMCSGARPPSVETPAARLRFSPECPCAGASWWRGLTCQLFLLTAAATLTLYLGVARALPLLTCPSAAPSHWPPRAVIPQRTTAELSRPLLAISSQPRMGRFPVPEQGASGDSRPASTEQNSVGILLAPTCLSARASAPGLRLGAGEDQPGSAQIRCPPGHLEQLGKGGAAFPGVSIQGDLGPDATCCLRQVKRCFLIGRRR